MPTGRPRWPRSSVASTATISRAICPSLRVSRSRTTTSPNASVRTIGARWPTCWRATVTDVSASWLTSATSASTPSADRPYLCPPTQYAMRLLAMCPRPISASVRPRPWRPIPRAGTRRSRSRLPLATSITDDSSPPKARRRMAAADGRWTSAPLSPSSIASMCRARTASSSTPLRTRPPRPVCRASSVRTASASMPTPRGGASHGPS